MVFYHKGLWVCKTPLSFVACDRKAAILRVQIWSAHESDVVGIIPATACHLRNDVERYSRFSLNNLTKPSLILNSLWRIAVDPHRGGSISLRLHRRHWRRRRAPWPMRDGRGCTAEARAKSLLGRHA